MSIQRNLMATALMTTALALVVVPLTATAYQGAQAAGVSKERFGKRDKARFVKKQRRLGKGFRKANRRKKASRVVQGRSRKVVNHRRIVRPAVTMPHTVIRPRPRPAVTMPHTVIKPRPRPAVTMPHTVIKPRPRPAVTMPAAGLGARPGNDPTAGRIQNRQAQNQALYHRCAAFSLRVFQAGLSQAGNDSARIRAARRHYQANLARCRALL